MSVIVEDISQGQESTPIPVINDIDPSDVPKPFRYTAINVPAENLDLEDFQTISQPCSCTTTCGEDDSSCSCKSVYDFHYENKLLKEEFFESGIFKPIVECSCLCKCLKTCQNRLSQHGIKYKLRVFKTKDKGYGIQTLEEIPKLSFVCEYAGEVISVDEAKKRFRSQKIIDPNYIFILKEHCMQRLKMTIVDPTFSGNIGRFLNHSCSPNLFMIPVRVNNMVPKLCLFSNRVILPLEELCYSYSGNSAKSNKTETEVVKSEVKSDENTARKKCSCESPNCSGYLPFDNLAEFT